MVDAYHHQHGLRQVRLLALLLELLFVSEFVTAQQDSTDQTLQLSEWNRWLHFRRSMADAYAPTGSLNAGAISKSRLSPEPVDLALCQSILFQQSDFVPSAA